MVPLPRAAASLALLSSVASALVLDGHVHISNLSFSYPWSSPCPNTPCPAAPPCICEWTVDGYYANSTRLPSDKFVFVEVAVSASFWLAEAQWVQGIADSGDKRVGGIIAQPPPGFGVPGADIVALGAALDKLASLPLARGVRISSVDFTNASLVPVVSQHVGLLAARGLTSVDVILPLGALALAVDHLAAIAASQPSVTFILDHIGSPPYLLANASLLPGWQAAMTQLGKVVNFVCKVGGVLQGFKSTGIVPGVDVVRPFVEHALMSFGYEKSLYEGNWFFVNWLSPPLLDQYNLFAGYLDDILTGLGATVEDREAYFWKTASLAYRVAAP
jgi:predicted TIM-barrel fold metal-dependent hydrolase